MPALFMLKKRREERYAKQNRRISRPYDEAGVEMQFNSAAAVHAGAEDHGLFAVDPHIGQVDVIHDFGNDVFSSF